MLLTGILSAAFLAQGCCSVPTERTADKIQLKVAVVYEDPAMPQLGGERISASCVTPGYTYRWNDPREQMPRYRDILFEVSHGVADYRIVEVIEADRFFTYRKDDPLHRHLTFDDMGEMLKRDKWGPELERNLAYDYSAMIKHYGFDIKRDAGEIDEVWVDLQTKTGN